MKISSFILIVCFSTITFVQAQVKPQSLKKINLEKPIEKETVWYYDTITSYYCDDTSFDHRYIQSFDKFGNILLEKTEKWIDSVWENISIFIYTYIYDDKGNVLTKVTAYNDIRERKIQIGKDSIWLYKNTSHRSDYTYDNDGNIIKEIIFYFDKQDNTDKIEFKEDSVSKIDKLQTIYTYDIKGNLLNGITEDWVYNNSFKKYCWENRDRFLYTYNANNQILLYLNERWKNNSWVQTNKETYTYDDKKNLLSHYTYEWEDSIWIYKDKINNIYDSVGNILTSTHEYPTLFKRNDKTTWDTKFTNYIYDLNSRLISTYSKIWKEYYLRSEDVVNTTFIYNNNGELLTKIIDMVCCISPIDERIIYNYDKNGDMITKTVNFYDDDKYKWNTFSKVTYTYDSNGNSTKGLAERYKNNQWVYDCQPGRMYLYISRKRNFDYEAFDDTTLFDAHFVSFTRDKKNSTFETIFR